MNEIISQPTTLPDQLKTLDQDRLRTYREYLDFYSGSQWLTQSRKERQLTFNYAKVSIDKLTSYLMSGLDFAVDPVEAAGPDTATGRSAAEARDRARAAEASIYRVYRDNGLDALDFETEIDAAVLGDGAYKVTWDSQAKRVRVTSPDVQGLFAWHQADDPSQVYRVAQRYSMPAEEAQSRYGASPSGAAPGTGPSGTGRRDAEIVEDWRPQSYTLWVDGAVVITGPNPYGFIPYVIFPDRPLASP